HLRQLTLAALLAAAPGAAFAADDGWQAQVGQALGKTGSAAPGGVYRVGLPRTDLKVTLDGVALRAGFALGGWLAFEKMGDQGMVMGDLVLTMDEVAPVMTKLAAALHTALAESKTPLGSASAAPAAAPPQIDLDTAALDQTLGAKGTNNGG